MSTTPRRLLSLVLAILLAIRAGGAICQSGEAPDRVPPGIDPLQHAYHAELQAALTAFGKSVEHFSGGQFAAALDSLPDERAADSTAVADYIQLFRARSSFELGKGREASALFRALRKRYPDSPLAAEAVRGEAESLLKLGEASEALKVLQAPQSESGAKTGILRAEALERTGERREAIRVYLEIYSENPGSNEAVRAERRLQALSPAFQTRPENREQLIRRSENLIRAGRNLDARRLLLKLDTTNAAKLQADRVAALIADADTNLTRWTEALKYLRRITDPALAARVNYLEAVCYRGLRNEAAFLERRDRALRLYPRSPSSESLLYSVATYYDVDNRSAYAEEAYLALVGNFPKGDYAERALWRLATFAFANKRYEDALDRFGQFLLSYSSPGTAGAPAYWMGRCWEQLGNNERAVRFFRRAADLAENSYYGQRAREAMASLAPSAVSPPAGSTAKGDGAAQQRLDSLRLNSPAIPQLSPAVVPVIERARQLEAAGLQDLASAELARACDATPRTAAICYALSRVYAGKNDYYGVISTLRRVFPDYTILPTLSLPSQVWEMLFPVRHIDIIRQHATRNRLDPELVLGLIRQESAFQASALSRAGARGLMQVLPSTGRALAAQAGIKRYTASRLYQPETNIELGTRYLASLLQRYGGRVELALAAYNAGHTRVDRWVHEFGDSDMAVFVERIPFSETRGYVKQVLTNRSHYLIRAGAADN